MKTNATTKTKEEELSEWILEVMNHMGFDPKFFTWVAMAGDQEVFCFKSKPDLSKSGAYWVYSVNEPFVSLGYLPDHLCLWPWHEFLLQWGPKPLTSDTCPPTPDPAPGRMERAVQVLRRLTTEPSPPLITDHCTLNTPPFQRCVWAADVMSEAYRITVAIVEEPLPAPQEVPHWRLPTDEELDRLLPGGWTERCPLDL